MRRLAWLFVLPLAICQYQPQQQQNQQQPRYINQPNNPNGVQQYGNQQFGSQNQFNPQQQNQNGQQQPQYMQRQGMQQPPNQNQQWQQQQQGQQNRNYQGGAQQGAQYGQNGQYQNSNQQQAPGRSEISNTPTRLVGSNINGYTDINLAPGATVTVQLTQYTNNDLSLSNTTTCSCPMGRNCDFLPPTGQNDCSFSFTTVISAKEQSVQFIQSDFYPFTGQIQSGNWTNIMVYSFPSKPVAIDVFVQHLGVVIHKTTGSLMYFNHLSLVDSFVYDMSSFIPTQNPQAYGKTLQGNILGTSLTVSVSVQCINARMGDNCDLTCDVNSNSNQNTVVCTDTLGRNTSCKWSNSYKSQVTDCLICTGPVINGTCSGTQYLYNNGRPDGYVSYAFRTWTIVLGCLLGLALLLILCLIISFIILRNRTDQDETPPANYKQQDSYANGRSAASRPLLQEDEWVAPASTRRGPIVPERTDDYGNRGLTRDTTNSASRQEHQV